MGVAVVSVAAGIVFLAAPRKTIEAQIAVYRLINWRMEPISWEKELRNTRIMGLMSLVAGIAALFFTAKLS
ncbi:MAG: hypothetical protein ACREH5_04695 [Candidatus Omnitrophota bacterium]